MILMGTGSELELAYGAAEVRVCVQVCMLAAAQTQKQKKSKKTRVVSLPSSVSGLNSH